MTDRDVEPPAGDEETELKTYECDNCGHRVQAEHQPEVCPVCGEGMFDISVPRE